MTYRLFLFCAISTLTATAPTVEVPGEFIFAINTVKEGNVALYTNGTFASPPLVLWYNAPVDAAALILPLSLAVQALGALPHKSVVCCLAAVGVGLYILFHSPEEKTA